jgi:hypothetical protein
MLLIYPAKAARIQTNGIKSRSFAAHQRILAVPIVLEKINGTIFKKSAALLLIPSAKTALELIFGTKPKKHVVLKLIIIV